jgi:nucleoid-associated protein YgaU
MVTITILVFTFGFLVYRKVDLHQQRLMQVNGTQQAKPEADSEDAAIQAALANSSSASSGMTESLPLQPEGAGSDSDPFGGTDDSIPEMVMAPADDSPAGHSALNAASPGSDDTPVFQFSDQGTDQAATNEFAGTSESTETVAAPSGFSADADTNALSLNDTSTESSGVGESQFLNPDEATQAPETTNEPQIDPLAADPLADAPLAMVHDQSSDQTQLEEAQLNFPESAPSQAAPFDNSDPQQLSAVPSEEQLPQLSGDDNLPSLQSSEDQFALNSPSPESSGDSTLVPGTDIADLNSPLVTEVTSEETPIAIAMLEPRQQADPFSSSGSPSASSFETDPPSASRSDNRRRTSSRSAQHAEDSSEADAAGGFNLKGYNYQSNDTAPPDDSANYDVITVEPGDNYSKISRRVYGTSRYFSALAVFNQHRISDPRKMRPGMKVLTPPAEVLDEKYPELLARHPENPIQQASFLVMDDGSPAYRVGESETLSEISQRFLGRSTRWTEIFRLNQGNLKNPNKLKPGTILILPADAVQVNVAQ